MMSPSEIESPRQPPYMLNVNANLEPYTSLTTSVSSTRLRRPSVRQHAVLYVAFLESSLDHFVPFVLERNIVKPPTHLLNVDACTSVLLDHPTPMVWAGSMLSFELGEEDLHCNLHRPLFLLLPTPAVPSTPMLQTITDPPHLFHFK